MSRILAVRMVDGWAVVLAALLALPCVARSVQAQREASSRAELGYSPVANLSYQPQADLGYVSPEQRAILGAAKTHQGSQSVLTNDPAVR